MASINMTSLKVETLIFTFKVERNLSFKLQKTQFQWLKPENVAYLHFHGPPAANK
jgi:hypothetical protein